MPPAYIRSKKDGDVFTSPAGPVWITHQRCRVTGRIDAGGAEFGVRGADGCHELQLELLEITNAGHGCRITNAEKVTIVGVKAHHCGAEGLQGGGLTEMTVEDTECWENGTGEGVESFYRHKGHGLYFEGTNITLRRVRSWENDGCGLQARGGDWLIESCEFTRNLIDSGVGAPDLQLNGIVGASLMRCYIGEGNGGLTLHNEERPCRNIIADDCAIWSPEGKFALNALGGAILSVRGGLLCGKLVGTQPALAPDATHYPTATPAAKAALAEWKGDTSPEPEPPGEDLAAQNALLKAEVVRLRTLLSDIELLAGQR